MKKNKCPGCHNALERKLIELGQTTGKIQCPHCHRQISVTRTGKGHRGPAAAGPAGATNRPAEGSSVKAAIPLAPPPSAAAAAPPGSIAAAGGPAEQAASPPPQAIPVAPPPPPLSQAPGPLEQLPRATESQGRVLPSRPRSPRKSRWMWIAIPTGAALALIVVVVIAVSTQRGDGPVSRGSGSHGAAEGRSADGQESPPLIDLSGLSELETSTAPKIEPNTPSLPDRPTTGSFSSSDDWGWGAAVTLIRVESGAALSVDGVRLDDEFRELAGNRPWTLVMPRGTHMVLQSGRQRTARVPRGFAEFYRQQEAEYQVEGRLDFERLAAATIQLNGVFREPLLPHVWGNYYWQVGEQEAAIRHWKTAIRIEPTFAPAHLNLAFAYTERGDIQMSHHELRLSRAFNVQNGYGLTSHIRSIKQRMGPPPETTMPFDPDHYLPANMQQLAESDRQVSDALLALSDLAETSAGKAMFLNNLGVYFIQRAGVPEMAVPYLLRAHKVLTTSEDPPADLWASVISNLADAAARARLPEAKMFQRLKATQ